MYIKGDTCPPFNLLVLQVSTTEKIIQHVPPVLDIPVALLRSPGVSPPRPASFFNVPVRRRLTSPHWLAKWGLEEEYMRGLLTELIFSIIGA